MKLADLRRLAILKQSAIRFRVKDGMECVMSEHGVAHVPGLAGVPGFNLEEELERAPEFVLTTSGGEATARRLSRKEIEDMAAGIRTPGAGHEQD